jgi:hypothetical protein
MEFLQKDMADYLVQRRLLATEVTPGLQQEQSPTPISFMSR